ncbi:acyl-CoA dehydrogenase family protein [Nocardia salmonicida]|uniref:acyl-CoA dehydrogenase family protein n=1 Tax=Nocardia salmonicida TaxID=53431 RepID=UPI0037B91596
MTTVDVPRAHARVEASTRPEFTDPTTTSLHAAVLGNHPLLHDHVRSVIVGLDDSPCSGTTYSEEASQAPALLRAALAKLGGSSAAIAADPRLRGILCEWAAVSAPHLVPVLTGHLDLSVGAIATLGNGSAYQSELAAELDDGTALGELALTELGGTNGADQQTIALWDRLRDGFWLDSPTTASWKFMPNIALPTARIGVTTARLIVDGVDEGVLPFLMRFRDGDGSLIPGLHVSTLPDKSWAPMDHAMIRFNAVFVPRDALLGGDWAVMTPAGLDCDLEPRARWHRAIGMLGEGRLDLANAAAAAARAGLAVLHQYTGTRKPGSVPMAERGTVRRDVVSALAAVTATSVLGRRIQDMRAEAEAGDPVQAMLSMLAKPLLAYTAHDVLLTCRQRGAAQASLRVNWIGDWIGVVEGIITAEGESQVLLKQAGLAVTSGMDITALRLRHTPPHLPWYVRMLGDREQTLAAGLRSGKYTAAGTAIDRDTAAIELATATGERLATVATIAAASRAADPTARAVLESAAAVYALERIYSRGGWYVAHRQMSSRRAHAVEDELLRHRVILGEHTDQLINAFDIPLDELDAPMASANYLDWWQDWAQWPSSVFGRSLRDVSWEVPG